MAKTTFSSHGFSYEFEDNSGEIMKAFQNALERGLEAIGMTAEGYAKEKALVDTGRLRNSISHKVKDNDVYIGTNVSYAITVETGAAPLKEKDPSEMDGQEGTPHKGGRIPTPFLKPAAAEHTAEYRKILEDSFENA